MLLLWAATTSKKINKGREGNQAENEKSTGKKGEGSARRRSWCAVSHSGCIDLF